MIDLIRQRLDSYTIQNDLEEENALKEIFQEILLFALWDAGFFEVAAFQGGTSLRILYGLPRFSEDLDFILLNPNQKFLWQPYLDSTIQTCMDFGIESEAVDKTQMNQQVKRAVIKDNSIANQLNLSFVSNHSNRKINIKLEIDSNPPLDSLFEYTYLDFPVDFEICHQDLSSNFALKIHALLCRPYLKGRDWYDFNWYISQGVKPNLKLLENALFQYGPWKNTAVTINSQWLLNTLKDKITSIIWLDAADDVKRFLRALEQKSLSLWSEKLFLSKLHKLETLLVSSQ
jgi:predicted nucleotidyltransferase component of viral defense system